MITIKGYKNIAICHSCEKPAKYHMVITSKSDPAYKQHSFLCGDCLEKLKKKAGNAMQGIIDKEAE